MLPPDEATHNHLLASLPVRELARIRPALERVELKAGQVLYIWGEEIDYVYFPTTAVIALLHPVENGMSIEVGMVGREGILGIEIFLGGTIAPGTAVVQNKGVAYRMQAGFFRLNCVPASSCRDPLLRYTHSLIGQISQSAVCNRFHTNEQRFARWLLESLDRAEASRLTMTHQQMADLLGVRRESVSLCAHALAVMGLVKVQRGKITILDRPGLESATCECYEAAAEYEHLLRGEVAQTFREGVR